jgi:hypothetical protein
MFFFINDSFYLSLLGGENNVLVGTRPLAAMGWGAIETLDLIFKKLPKHTFMAGRYIKNSPSIRKILTTGSFYTVYCLSSPVVVSDFNSWFER